MNNEIKKVISSEVITQFIDNNGDLYEIINQDASDAVIYYHEAHSIVNEATQDETEYASDQMHDTGFVFKDADDTVTVCAYWIMTQRLREQYHSELDGDKDSLMQLHDDLTAKQIANVLNDDKYEEITNVIEELAEIIELIEAA